MAFVERQFAQSLGNTFQGDIAESIGRCVVELEIQIPQGSVEWEVVGGQSVTPTLRRAIRPRLTNKLR